MAFESASSQQRSFELGLPSPISADERLDPDAVKALVERAGDEAVLQNIVDTTSAGDQVAAIQQFAAEGVIDQNLINKAASDAGVEPSVMEGQIETVRTAMLAQANAVVAKHGVSPEAVFEWANANEHHREQLGEAVRRHAMQRVTTGYGDVARAYLEALPEHDPALILNSDFGGQAKAHQDRDTGKIIITMNNGHQLEWRAALKAGLLRVG